MMQYAAPSRWTTRRAEKARRLARITPLAQGNLLPTERIIEALEAVLVPGDRVALEGDNQKQADFLSRSLSQVNPDVIHDLHLLMASVSRPEHLNLFEQGIAHTLDFAYASPQSLRVSQLLEDGNP